MSCAPGAEAAKVTWIGTCENPKDGKDYLVSDNDYCGVQSCGRCVCNYNVGKQPGFRMGLHNDINWCMAKANQVYQCTVSVSVGLPKA